LALGKVETKHILKYVLEIKMALSVSDILPECTFLTFNCAKKEEEEMRRRN